MALPDTEDFLSQTGKVTIGLARLLLRYRQGERLPRMVDVARRLRSGNGTVQEAFSYLTRAGAIVVAAHGAQGSILEQVNYPLLWRYAGNEWIIGSMPLPYTLRYEGLATALYDRLEASGLPFNMTYQRGSLSRAEMVRQGHYHYAVMSLLAAEHLVERYPELAIVTSLPPGSYVSEHILISRLPREQIRRVGIDQTSLDEILLTAEEFRARQDWESVPATRLQVLDLLREGQFDAIIWNREGVGSLPPTLQLLPLQGEERLRILATQAAIVALREAPVYQVLTSIFAPEEITTAQREVLDQRRLPRY
ncbi:GntR family transcriptional regulator YhfZ [Thermogemmatispora tikiterensis]|uniref:Uncharacterized protein n=1 Tax=Thermogemmatispora tikiterensis TaxID=1825093 RepID=A0A328VJE6_9CHLR|nr:GntR family transcriptional regulator YhfZ [Thermogemmatispora tikiterensis]RAQ97597.1 hypothetical protein A4R35_18815 [Thermogemmatispora tikiterensis]